MNTFKNQDFKRKEQKPLVLADTGKHNKTHIDNSSNESSGDSDSDSSIDSEMGKNNTSEALNVTNTNKGISNNYDSSSS